MSTVLDASVGFGLESIYGTGVTPTRWLEYTDQSMDYKPVRKQSTGLRVGTRVARADRRVSVTSEGVGDVSLEVLTKGLGMLWQVLMGAGSSTLVAGTTYQQVFTLGDALQEFTLQAGVPRIAADGPATIDPLTFTGCVAPDFELTGGVDILKLKASIDAQAVTTSTAYAAPSFTTGANLLSFAGASLYTGTLTAPTTIALASAATPLASVNSWSVKVDHKPFADRYLFGNAGKKSRPIPGFRSITGKLEVEYSDTVFRDAFLADTDMSLVVTYTGGALSEGFETLQVVIPDIRLDGQLPSGGGDLVKMSCGFTGLDGLVAAQPLWIVARTSDAAL